MSRQVSQKAAIDTNLYTFGRQLHDWGAAVTAIREGTKQPGHSWKRWQRERQTLSELDGLPWGRAVAAFASSILTR